jgi:regulatory protein
MAVITKISQQKRAENRRNIYLDGKFAFGCNLNVVAKFRLHEGMLVDDVKIREIELGEVKQECFDRAMHFLQSRLHSRAELRRKLARKEWGDEVIDAVLSDLARLGYLDDERFAKVKALSAAEHKQHGRRRAFVDLMKAGVKGDLAEKALADVYTKSSSEELAREVARKAAKKLQRLDPVVARRRLIGMLQRRGFDYDSIRPVLDEALGKESDPHSD